MHKVYGLYVMETHLMNKVLLSSKNMNWGTPESVLEKVRLMDNIGLDPATSEDNPTKAAAFFTPTLDGLKQSWTDQGLVYCNCPYGRSTPSWVAKAAHEAKKGAEIVLLIPARTDTKYFQTYVPTADAVCFWRGRLTFVGAKDPAPFPSALVYWGLRAHKFAEVFGENGWIIYP